MKKVSVIVPVYNTVDYLKRCFDSLVNQTLEGIEVVVVDDGSTDGSSAMIDEYAAKYPDTFVVFHKPNGGQASARNLALDHCSGEFIGFLDSDDFVALDMFEKLYNAAKQNDAEYVGTAYCEVELLDNGEVKVTKEYSGYHYCATNKERFKNADVSPFINLYKADILLKTGIKFPEGIIYEDTTFWMCLVPYFKKLAYVEEALGYRVWRRGSTMYIAKPEKVANIFKALSLVIDYYKNNNLWDEYFIPVEAMCSRILLCSSLRRIAAVKSRKDRKRLIQESFDFLKKWFPEYRKNPELTKSPKDLYIKYANQGICMGVADALHVLKK